MAVAEDAVNPSPPPASWIVVALVALVRVAVPALLCLAFVGSWVLSAVGAAMVVARLAGGGGSATFVFLQALVEGAIKIFYTSFLVAGAAVLLCSRFLYEFVPGSGSEPKKSPFEAAMEESTKGLFRFFHVVVLGFVADLAFVLLIFAGALVMMVSSPVVGSVIMDVGYLAISAISCFVILPAVALSVWMKYQSDRKEASQFC